MSDVIHSEVPARRGAERRQRQRWRRDRRSGGDPPDALLDVMKGWQAP